jgi:hypothetical protein
MEAGKPSVGAAPWLLWGQELNVPIESDVVRFNTSPQLVQIRYARPESWRFFFKVQIGTIQGSTAGAVMQVDYNLTFGVGRNTTSMGSTVDANGAAAGTPFARFRFDAAVAGEFVSGSYKCCSSVEFPKENNTRVSNNVVDHIVAETIQLQTLVTFPSGLGLLTPGSSIVCTAFFSPEVHIRPDWFIRNFPGNEHQGH